MNNQFKYVAFDLETIPNQTIDHDCLPKPDMSKCKYGNAKNVILRQEIEQTFVAEFEASQDKRMSLDPYCNQIVVIVAYDGARQKFFEGTSLNEADEYEMLCAFWEWGCRRYQEGFPFTGFNSASFDLPTLLVRSMLLDITVDPGMVHALNERQDYNQRHYDLMVRWPLSYRHPFTGEIIKKNLDYQLKRFGLPGKLDGMSGAMVYPAFQEGRINDILTYCRDGDVKGTSALFERVYPWMVKPRSVNLHPEKEERNS